MKKKKGSNENVLMTKKEREAMEAQLVKESEIRKKICQVSQFFWYSLLEERTSCSRSRFQFSDNLFHDDQTKTVYFCDTTLSQGALT